MYKNIPIILSIAWVWKGEEIPYPFTDHVLTALIILGLDGYLWITLPMNHIKLGRECILGACIRCIYLIVDVIQVELTIMDRYFPVLDFSL